jgi:CDP-glycerol glycerophosphotransferase
LIGFTKAVSRALSPLQTVVPTARHKVEVAKRVAMDHLSAVGSRQRMVAGTVLYESFDGTGYLCNPERIFRELAQDPRFDHLEHVWVEREHSSRARRSVLLRGLRPQVRVRFVRYRSPEYFVWLGRAQYLINNSSFPPEFSKKPEQTYINTWHGVPLKKMGYHIEGGREDTRNVVRNLLAADYVVSTGPWMTTTMYADAFKLQGLFQGKVLETGYPRIDTLLSPDAHDDALTRWAEYGINIPRGARVVLWCPTWRGANPYAVEDDSVEIQRKVDELQALLGPTYFVVAKLHQLTLRKIPESAPIRSRLVPNEIPIDEALAATDHLVTDYSSVFFDFLVTDRPIHFLVDDLDEYQEVRGLYVDAASLPGTVSTSVEELGAAIRAGDSEDLTSRRNEWRTKYVPVEDGHSARRLVEAVFDGVETHAVALPQDKQKLLIHAGSLIPNGITSAALALIENLDYEKYDVTVLYPFSKDGYQHERAMEIDERARILPRIGRTAMKVTDRPWYTRYTKDGGRRAEDVDLHQVDALFAAEKRRCFGDSEFDVVLAFDGYQVFWAQLLLATGAARKLIWAHNDLRQDAERTIDGHQPHRKNLYSLFTLYDEFDQVVSVTKELAGINAEKLGEFASADKFVSVRNFLRPEFVRAKGSESLDAELPGSPGHRFVTVARLSPEKNQARIIRAFAHMATNDPEAGLTIVGDGPLRGELETLARASGVADRVLFAGLQTNPFPWIEAADAFVFASVYEGQGLAILEALLLDKWVITTEFNVVREVLKPGQGDIVNASDVELANAMSAFVTSSTEHPSDFDAAAYNRHVRAELDRALGGCLSQ